MMSLNSERRRDVVIFGLLKRGRYFVYLCTGLIVGVTFFSSLVMNYVFSAGGVAGVRR